MSKREIDKRLDKVTSEARVRQLGILPIIDVTKWPEEDRLTFALATKCRDQSTCEMLIGKHFGKLPERMGDEIIAIIVSAYV